MTSELHLVCCCYKKRTKLVETKFDQKWNVRIAYDFLKPFCILLQKYIYKFVHESLEPKRTKVGSIFGTRCSITIYLL